MDYQTILGMVVTAVIALVGCYAAIKKNISDERKPMEDLNNNITKLNLNFEHMLQQDGVRDKRIEKHGQEIDEIREQQNENEKILGNHETRISYLERKRSNES